MRHLIFIFTTFLLLVFPCGGFASIVCACVCVCLCNDFLVLTISSFFNWFCSSIFVQKCKFFTMNRTMFVVCLVCDEDDVCDMRESRNVACLLLQVFNLNSNTHTHHFVAYFLNFFLIIYKRFEQIMRRHWEFTKRLDSRYLDLVFFSLQYKHNHTHTHTNTHSQSFTFHTNLNFYSFGFCIDFDVKFECAIRAVSTLTLNERKFIVFSWIKQKEKKMSETETLEFNI